MVFNSDIRNGFIQYGQSLQSLNLITGSLNGQTELLAKSVQNLTPKQQALALATRGVNQAQIAEVLSLNNVEEKQAQQVLFDTAIIQKKKQLTKAYALEAITAQGLSTEKANEIMKSAGIIAANNSEVISKKKVSVATLEAKLAQEGLSATQIKAITTQLGLGTSTLTLSNYFKGLAASTWASVKAIGAFLVSNPVGWCIMAAGAIAGVVAAIDLFTVSLKEQQEITQKLQDEYDEITQKLSDVESELKTVTDRIDELNRKEHLSFVEQEELDKLTETNNQLERQNAILKEQQEIKGRELAKSIQAEYKKDFQDNNFNNQNASRFDIIDSELQKYTELQEAIAKTQNEINLIEQQGFDIPTEYTRSLDRMKEEQDNIRKKLVDDAVDIQEYINKYNLDDDFAKQLQRDFEEIDRTLNPAEYKEIDFNRIIKADKFKDDIEEIKQLTKDGILDKTVLNKQFPDLVEAMDEMGISIDEIIEQFYSLNEVSDSENFEKSTESAMDLSSALENLSKKTSAIKSAMEDMADTGYISASTYSSLVELGGNYADCLEIQNGKLTLNIDKLKELETQEYKNAISANELAIAEMQMNINSAVDYQRIKEKIDALKTQNAVWQTLIDEIYNAKPDKKKSSSDPYKDEAEGKIAEIKHQYEMEQISYKDYIDGIEKINQEYFANKTKYLDEYYKYEEEVYKGRKQLAEDFYDSQRDYYKDRVSDLEAQIEITTKDSTDNNGNLLNAEEKFAYVRSIYSDILATIQEDINDIVQNGIEGHEDDLKELEQQYEKYVREMADVFKDEVESEIDYIQDLQDTAEKAFDDKIDKIEAEKKAMEDRYDAEIDWNELSYS